LGTAVDIKVRNIKARDIKARKQAERIPTIIAF
jgi:hypothetical protein